MSYTEQHPLDLQYDFGLSSATLPAPLSATLSGSSSTASSDRTLFGMNDGTNGTTVDPAMAAKMLNNNFGMANGYAGNGMMNMNGLPNFGGQQQQPQQFNQFGQQQQQQFRPNLPQGQFQAPQAGGMPQFAPPSHPGGMPNIRPNPGGQGGGGGGVNLQNMQTKALMQSYQRMQQHQSPNPNSQMQQNGLPTNIGQNMTPYQQQQHILQMQQQQKDMAAQRHQQSQQQIMPQHSGGFNQPLAPQHSGQQQQQQQQQPIMPQHSGQMNMMNGLPQNGGVNPAALAQQQQHFKMQQQQQQAAMMNGNQIARPGTAAGGGAINPAMMFSNNVNMQQMLQQQQLRQQQQILQQQQSQQAQQHMFDNLQHQQQQPPVPPSPALSSTSISRQQHAMNQQPSQQQMGPPQSVPPHQLQRAPSQQAMDSPAQLRAMTRTPVMGVGGMSPPPVPASRQATPVNHPPNGPQEVMSRPMSRMSSSGGGPAGSQQGWNGQSAQPNGFGGNMQMNRPGPNQGQQMPQPGQQQQQQRGFGPASAATLQGIPPQQLQQQPQPQPPFYQPPQGPQQHIPPQQQMQQAPQVPMAPPMQPRQSQDQLSINIPPQGHPAGSMPPPAAPALVGMGTPVSGSRSDSMPPSTPVTAQHHPMGASLPNGGAGMHAGSAQQLAMIQQQARLNQPGGAGRVGQHVPSAQEILQSLPPHQQQQLMSMPEPQKSQQILQLQMRIMANRQAHAQAQQHAPTTARALPQPAAAAGLATTSQQGLTASVPPAHPPVPSPAQPSRPPGPQLPPHLVGKVDNRMVVITPLPYVKNPEDVTHGGALPPLSDREIEKIKGWMAKDKEYISLVDKGDADRKARTNKEMTEALARPRWFEIDGHPLPPPGQKLSVLWPQEKRKVKRAKLGRLENRFPLQYKPEEVDAPEELVPIRLEVEYEQYRFRDTLIWNMADPVVTPEKFSAMTVEDFGLPSAMAGLITKQIQEQLTEHKASDLQQHVNANSLVDVDGEENRGQLEGKDEVWWEGWRKRLRTSPEGEFVKSGLSDEEDGELKRKQPPVKQEDEDDLKPIDVKNLPPLPELKNNPELRIMIKLDILVGAKHLVDQFEWDILETINSPELFAAAYAADLGLSGEFKTAIAHDIREQVTMYQRALVSVGHAFDGGVIFDDDLRQAILPPVSIAGRTAEQASVCMPIFNNLSDGEVEANEKEREKELKRKKRQGRSRRGGYIVDREPQKTHRTLPGCADVGAVLPPPAPVSVPSRRQAAVNASQTIASLVAQENSNGYVAPVATPTRDSHLLAPPTAGGNAQSRSNKRQKVGHVNPPSFPDIVLRPRARMDAASAPPSTGVPPPPKTAEQIAADNEARENERARMPEWHCSTCGCPDSIAVGRRKGPKGDKSQCGPCGKYYHRYRRTKDVVYNPDPEYHLALIRQEQERKKRKRPEKKKKAEAEVVADESGNEGPAPEKDHADDDDDEDDEDDGPPLSQLRRPKSPELSPSPPLASVREEKAKAKVVEKVKEDVEMLPPPKEPTPPPPPPPRAPTPPTVVVAPATPVPAPPPQLPTTTRSGFNPETPEWMLGCLHELQAKYQNDRFTAIIRPPQAGAGPGTPREWRIKCFDCPGKVYTPGPEETLTNFEVHLKNKRHRDNVNMRLSKERGTSAASSGSSSVAPPS